MRLIRIGRVAGPHGLKGGLRFKPDNPESDSLAAGQRVFIETAAGRREFEIAALARVGQGQLRLDLAGVTTIEQAEELGRGALLVGEAYLPKKAAREFYYYEAIGCEVVTLEGRRLGAIVEVFDTGANDVWVVRDGASEVLVPVIEDVVREMDLKKRRVVIEAVKGLLG